jgi:hypothetical protein
MSKFKDYLMKKYGTTEVPSRFEIAKIKQQEGEELLKRQRKQIERRKTNTQVIQDINRGIHDLDNYWLRVDLPDGRTIIYKDGKQYDIDTGEELFDIFI